MVQVNTKIMMIVSEYNAKYFRQHSLGLIIGGILILSSYAFIINTSRSEQFQSYFVVVTGGILLTLIPYIRIIRNYAKTPSRDLITLANGQLFKNIKTPLNLKSIKKIEMQRSPIGDKDSFFLLCSERRE